MRIDNYTKAMLTIIAACLLTITGDIILSSNPAQAAGIMSVNIEQINGRSLFGDALPVRVK